MSPSRAPEIRQSVQEGDRGRARLRSAGARDGDIWYADGCQRPYRITDCARGGVKGDVAGGRAVDGELEGAAGGAGERHDLAVGGGVEGDVGRGLAIDGQLIGAAGGVG